MTKKQIQTIASAIFHDGIDVDKLSEKAKSELRQAVEVLIAAHREEFDAAVQSREGRRDWLEKKAAMKQQKPVPRPPITLL